ncbi:ABC-2 type transport system ATP-binding protein [Krasilnikovia cinnamomea]|uniref:ABC-2 type transport system ATP-binding protein n=1 Tax=Krasilnikovia cinnamomea TaxID=349313 RepID=A0A4V2G745_9ACTN|nr:ATP-binding cassette domain-containing protein [Krasilnikovia cinnamomea]RZU51176.1 ABC-2 type transport system ATP-binding protein [Krasilnikovia cinnamomea]
MEMVTTAGLTRRFGKLTAVKPLTVDLPAGKVIGLVGPNGSGKSTLIRMLLGLMRPSAGDATVLGAPISAPQRYLGRVGALVENPAFVPGLSARANLMSLARLRGLPNTRVDAVLHTVGLTGRDREPVKRYSLGMKQRLGIAAALLPDPALLILDEPTNGLDPSGIVEIRSLLAQLGTAGRTVLVSSHLLSEIEAICEHLVVIRFGELLYSGPITGLLTSAGQHVDLRAEHDADTLRLVQTLQAQGWQVASNTDGEVRVSAGAQDAAPINRAAHAAGITLRSLSVARDSLEDVFLAMTGDTDQQLMAGRATEARQGAL